MTDASVIELATRTIIVTGKLCAPILVVSLSIGIAISLLQSVTQVQEVTLTFVPKLAGVGLVIVFGGHWMLDELVGFTRSLFEIVPQLLS